MPNSTSRLGLLQPVGTDAPAEIRIAETANTNTLDNAVTFSENTLSNLPSSGWLAGREFFATDSGGWYKDNGGAWVRMATLDGSGHVPLAQLSGITTSQLAAGAGQLVPATPAGNATAVVGQYVLAASGATITLPAASAGAVIGVEASRLASSAITVNTTSSQPILGMGVGPASSALSIQLGTPASYAVFMSFDGASWSIVGGQQDTGWVALSLGAGIGTAGSYTPAARLQGDTVRLKGILVNSSGGTINPPTVLATIPSGLRPTAQLYGSAVFPLNGTAPITIPTNGAFFSTINSVGNTATVGLDSVTYSLS